MNDYIENVNSGLSRSENLERASFIKKTYLNLVLALGGFAAIEAFLLNWTPSLALA